MCRCCADAGVVYIRALRRQLLLALPASSAFPPLSPPPALPPHAHLHPAFLRSPFHTQSTAIAAMSLWLSKKKKQELVDLCSELGLPCVAPRNARCLHRAHASSMVDLVANGALAGSMPGPRSSIWRASSPTIWTRMRTRSPATRRSRRTTTQWRCDRQLRGRRPRAS